MALASEREGKMHVWCDVVDDLLDELVGKAVNRHRCEFVVLFFLVAMFLWWERIGSGGSFVRVSESGPGVRL